MSEKNDMLCQHFADDGWREYRDAFKKRARCFAKRFDTPTRCGCNSDKAGMQVVVSVADFDGYPAMQGLVTYEISLTGELSDGSWIELHQWMLPDDIAEGLKLIPRLLDTWEHIAGAKKD